jgi:hypothetical protein
MIKEFALEPEAMASWESFRYFIEKFGVAHGRVISRFPKDWKRLVYEAAQKVLGGTIQLSKLEVRLRAIGDDVLFPTGRPGGDRSKTWLQRALVEHAREPFAGIVACTNPNALPHILLQSELDDQDPRFSVPRQIEVERKAAHLVACAELMLRHTGTVKWVDYIIDLRKPRWRRPFGAALDVLRKRGQPVVFEVHRQFGNEVEKANLCQQFQDAMQYYRTPGITFALHLHPEQQMHDRFILTDRGGIQVGHGLDDNEDGGSVPTANVVLLEATMFQNQWQRFSGNGSLALRLDP